MRITIGQLKLLLEASAKTDATIFIPDDGILQKFLSRIIEAECSSLAFKTTVFPYMLETFKKAEAPSPKKFSEFLRSADSLAHRQIIDASVKQRRMDGLARLLSLPSAMTPCIAVAIHQRNLFIATNSLDTTSIDIVRPLLKLKMAIIQDCIRTLYGAIGSEVTSPISGLSGAGRLIVTLAVRNIRAQGGCGESLYADRKKKPNQLILEKALSKLVVYCLNNAAIRDEILGNSIIILSDSRIDGRSVHAEQQIILRISSSASKKGEPVSLGISKLSCKTCADALSQSPAIKFRGISGNKFPNVHSIFGNHSGKKPTTKLHADAVSESESEIDSFDFDEDLGPLASAATVTASAATVTAGAATVTAGAATVTAGAATVTAGAATVTADTEVVTASATAASSPLTAGALPARVVTLKATSQEFVPRVSL